MKDKFVANQIKWISVGIALIAFLVFLHLSGSTDRQVYILIGGSLVLVGAIIVFEYFLYDSASKTRHQFAERISNLAEIHKNLYIRVGTTKCKIDLERIFGVTRNLLEGDKTMVYGYQYAYYHDVKLAETAGISPGADETADKATDDIVIRNLKHDLMVNLDTEGNVIFVSEDTLKICNKQASAIIGKNIVQLHDLFGIDAKQWFEDIRTHFRSQSTVEYRPREGRKWLYWSFEAVTDVFDKILMIIGTGHEITNLINIKQHSHPNHTFDYQTNLINQQGLYERISGLKSVNRAVCFFIDLWQFSNVNDYYGHTIGDEIIVMIANQLRKYEGPSCIISRFSGSKFVVLTMNKEATEEALERHLKLIREFVSSVYQLEENVIQVDKRIGYAIYPDDCDSLEKLISLSSLAMKESKQENQFAIVKYQNLMGETLKKNIAISAKLKTALETGVIEVYFQKAIDAFTGEVVYLEELARWKDVTLGYIPPIDMFSAAKEANLIDQLDKYLVSESLRQFAYLRNSGRYPHAKLAINITPSSLMDPRFVDFVTTGTLQIGLYPANICIEVSESTFVNSLDVCVARIEDFKKRGFQIALDDFGKDYSSLAILESVPFDIIKIDKLFIDRLQDDKNLEIIKMIRNITNLYEKEIIAEGVETEDQKKCLLDLGCVIQQGYLHHRPEKLL